MKKYKINLKKLEPLLKQKKITKRDFAKKLGISDNGLQGILKNNSTKLETFFLICELLDVSPTYFIEGWTEEPTIKSREPRASSADTSRLREENKKLLQALEEKDEIIRLYRENQQLKEELSGR